MPGREVHRGRQLLHGVRARRQQADDPQPRRVGQRLQGDQQVVVHAPRSMPPDLMSVKSGQPTIGAADDRYPDAGTSPAVERRDNPAC